VCFCKWGRGVCVEGKGGWRCVGKGRGFGVRRGERGPECRCGVVGWVGMVGKGFDVALVDRR